MNNIIESMNILKNNKNNYENKFEYYEKINKLYEDMSKYNQTRNDLYNISLTDTEYENLLNDILKIKNSNQIINIKNFNKLYKINKLFKLLLIENNIIKSDLINDNNYHIQTEPIIEEQYNKVKIIHEIKTYLHLTEIMSGTINKCIIVIVIFDTILKNYKLVLEHERFKICIEQKINEFYDDKEVINMVIKKYNLDNSFFDKWKKIFAIV